jgi:hypothetical protein
LQKPNQRGRGTKVGQYSGCTESEIQYNDVKVIIAAYCQEINLKEAESNDHIRHGYGYVYRYPVDTDMVIWYFIEKPDTWIRF